MKINLGTFRRAASSSRKLSSVEVMEAIKAELGLGTITELRSGFSGGCINRAKAYKTDKYNDIFVKFNGNEKVSISNFIFICFIVRPFL